MVKSNVFGFVNIKVEKAFQAFKETAFISMYDSLSVYLWDYYKCLVIFKRFRSSTKLDRTFNMELSSIQSFNFVYFFQSEYHHEHPIMVITLSGYSLSFAALVGAFVIFLYFK